MRPGPHSLRGSFAAILLAACTPAMGAAQDVFQAGRPHGVTPTGPLARRAANDPTAFEFRRAWRNKAAAMRTARAALERRSGPRLSVAQLGANRAAMVGTMRVPVIAGLYADVSAPFTTAEYQERLFGAGTTRYTAKSFYQELSRGAFTMDGTVTPWLTLPQGRAYYEPSDASDPDFGRVEAFLEDALTAADPAMNFAQFDNDGPDGVPNSGDDDGYVDAAAFIYPAHGKACGGPGIWPHRWTYSSASGTGEPFITNDARSGGGFILVDDYLIQGGLECNGASLMEIGTFSHEMGHALGLPDLYATAGPGEGVGEWDLMGSGSYLRPNSPAHMGAWSKDFLGWVNVEPITASRPAGSLPAVYANGVVWRYDIPGSEEYFLMEYRRNEKADVWIREPGLLVWHIDPVIIAATSRFNRVNASFPLGVALEQADGRDQLASGANRSDAGDPFPGLMSNTTFGFAGPALANGFSGPTSAANNGQASGLQITNISVNGASVGMDLAIGAVLFTDPRVQMGTDPGGTVARGLTIEVAGGPAATVTVAEDAPWLTVSPASGTSPLAVVLTANATGLTPGGYETELVITSAGALNTGMRVPVSLQVGASAIIPGDSVRAAIGAVGERDTMNVTLTAGQKVDLAVFSRSGNLNFEPILGLLSPSGVAINLNLIARTAPYGYVAASYTPTVTGTYKLLVRDYGAGIGYAGAPQAYAVRTRVAAPVLEAAPTGIWHFAPAGSSTPQVDEVQVVNHGPGSASFTAQSNAPWLAVTPDGGVANGGAPAGSAALAPRTTRLMVGDSMVMPTRTGPQRIGPAVSLQVTSTPTGLPKGRHSGAVTLRFPADVFNGDVPVDVDMRLHDPASVQVNTSFYAFRGAAVSPEGFLAVGDLNGDLYRVNLQTGAATPWVANLDPYGVEFGADSAAYVADGVGKRVLKVARDGTVTTLFTTTGVPYDVAVLSDGTVYAAVGTQLLRWRTGDAAPAVVHTAAARGRFAPAIAYHQGYVYLTEAGRFRRVNVSNGAEQDLADLPASAGGALLNLSVSRNGRFYGTENNLLGSVLALTPQGAVADRIWGRSIGWGLALGEGALYGTGYLEEEVWKLPLSDGPAPRDVLMGDASGDGQITVADAVGVLSQVVGRALPAGWSATAGDANCDAETTAFDALVILSRIVGKDVNAFCVGTRR